MPLPLAIEAANGPEVGCALGSTPRFHPRGSPHSGSGGACLSGPADLRDVRVAAGPECSFKSTSLVPIATRTTLAPLSHTRFSCDSRSDTEQLVIVVLG